MSPMKRMPYHRIQRQLTNVQGWSNNFRVEIDNLKQAILNYKSRLENTLVQPHEVLEQGGHKASQIRSQNPELITAEAFCEEIRAARGEFGSVQERMANLNGVGFVKAWGSSSELLGSYQKQNSRVFNSRLECSEEPQQHSDIFGLENLNYANAGADQFDEFISANEQRSLSQNGLYSSTYGIYNSLTVWYTTDPLASQEQVFNIQAGYVNTWDTYSSALTYYFPQAQQASESLFAYVDFIPTSQAPTECYIELYADVNNYLQIRLSDSGIYVNGIFYSYSLIGDNNNWLNQRHKITISKFKNILWEVKLDGVLLVRQSYYGSSAAGISNTFGPYLRFYANNGWIYTNYGSGPYLGRFLVKEFGIKQFSSIAGGTDNILINPDNTITLTEGKFTGSYTSPVRYIHKNRGSIAKQVVNNYSGPAPKTYIKLAASEAALKNEPWTFLNAGTINNSSRLKPFCQLKLELSGTGSKTNEGSTVLLNTIENYRTTSLCKEGTPIASSSKVVANLSTLFTNTENSMANYWESEEVYTSIINSWVGYNFGKPVNIRTIVFAQAYIFASNIVGWNWLSSVKIQKSTNGNDWEDVQTSLIIPNSSVQTINVQETEAAQYWRLKANSQAKQSSAYIGWALSLLQMFDDSFILRETQNGINISDRLSYQGDTSQGVPNGDFSDGLTGWTANSEISGLEAGKTAAWQSVDSGPYQINGISTDLISPSFILSGPIEFAYKIKFIGGNSSQAKMRIYDSENNSLLAEENLVQNQNWTISKYYPSESILNKNVYIKFFVYTYNNYYLDRSYVYAGVGISYIKLSEAVYMSVPKKLLGNKVKKIKWKQKVGSGEPIVSESVYPTVLIKSGTNAGETLLASEVLLPVQVTPSGIWTDCSADVEQLGDYLSIGTLFGEIGVHDHLVELDSFEVEWEQITLESAPVVYTTSLNYESYLYYPEGETYYRFDSNDKGTKWGRFFCEGGLEPTASNDNNRWERRVIKNVSDNYLTVDDFGNSKATSVASPSAGSSFPVSGNGNNSACLFSAYFYNDTGSDVVVNVGVSSNSSSNKWQVFRNKNSLGLNKSSYNVLFQAKTWTRVDLYFKRFGSSSENFVTNVNWTSVAAVMNSTQNVNPEIGMFNIKVLSKLEDEPNVEWSVTSNDQSIGQTGRYLLVKVKTKATSDRMLSSGTVYFGASYTGDLGSGIASNIASLAENLARTNFELKTLTLADENNLLHIMQDVFENSDDISGLSYNVSRDSSVPGVVQIDTSNPGVLVSNVFVNPYAPSFGMVVADAIGEVYYAMSRDNGQTWTNLELSSMTPVTSLPGNQIRFRAILLNGAVLKRWALIL